MDQENQEQLQSEAVGDNVILSGEDQNMDGDQVAGDDLNQSEGANLQDDEND